MKRYSSGMYVRLAFSVAAHLEPEILVVDEVLAVGDVEFQKKCLGKMKDVSDEGRTIIFVSHNMAAIENLCNRGIILNRGSIEFKSDNIREVVTEYLKVSSEEYTSEWLNDGTYKHNSFTPKRFFLTNAYDNVAVNSAIANDQSVMVNIEFDVKEVHPALAIGYKLYSASNELIYISNTTDDREDNWVKIKEGYNLIHSPIPAKFLNEGEYRVELICSLNNIERIVEAEKDNIKIFFSIEGGLSNSPYWLVARDGILAPVMEWKALIN